MMEIELLKIQLFKIPIIILKNFMEKYSFKDDAMDEGELKKTCNFQTYPRYSKLITNKRYVHIDNGGQAVTHRACFYEK